MLHPGALVTVELKHADRTSPYRKIISFIDRDGLISAQNTMSLTGFSQKYDVHVGFRPKFNYDVEHQMMKQMRTKC